jgi:pyruvate dehydrogenase E2 component (dihydrolipoamide acetyltransferase)
MEIKVVMPQLGISTLEGKITAWLKKEGDRVVKGEPLFEIETDKATMEVESLGSGILKKILIHTGNVAQVTEAVAILADGRETTLEPAAAESPSPDVSIQKREDSLPSQPTQSRPQEIVAGRRRISPLARKIAAEAGIPLERLDSVIGTGVEKAISKDDVLKFLAENKPAQGQAPQSAHPLAAKEPQVKPIDSQQEVVPLSRMRRVIAERMVLSVREAPQFWMEGEASFAALIALRESMNRRLAGNHIKLSYTDFIVKAVASSLRECPFMNVSYSAAGIIRKPDVNLGVAVALDEGLIVPVIHNADRKTLPEIAQERSCLSESARKGALTEREISGGTFTVSNLGMFKVGRFAAILNPPEAGILSVGCVRQSIQLQDGQVRSIPTVSLGLTVDHRCVDGAQGAQFLEKIIERLQEPFLLLM